MTRREPPINRLRALVASTRDKNPALSTEQAIARLLGNVRGMTTVDGVTNSQWPESRVLQLVGVGRSGSLETVAAAVGCTVPEVKRQLWRIGELVLGGRL